MKFHTSQSEISLFTLSIIWISGGFTPKFAPNDWIGFLKWL